MSIQQAIKYCIEGKDLEIAMMESVMTAIMSGQCSDAQIGGFLAALAAKGESVNEITAAASVMRALALKVEPKSTDLVDIVGTGGDASGSFNVSTACSLVVAGAGAKVAKHGNRSVSSKSGAADLLEAAGVNLALNAQQVAQSIDAVGVGFMFAPNHHSAMKYAIGPRKEMAVRTVFNLLGPLTNPALARRQLLGVFARSWVQPIAQVLQKMGSERAMVVHSRDGMDEISIAEQTDYSLLIDGVISQGVIQPEDFGLKRASLSDIQVEGPAQSLAVIEAVLQAQPGAPRDMVLINSGAALFVAGKAQSIEAGVALAAESIDSGAAAKVLADLVAFTQRFKAEQ